VGAGGANANALMENESKATLKQLSVAIRTAEKVGTIMACWNIL
jgi:hypothetical protein